MSTYRIVENQHNGTFSIDKWHNYLFGKGRWKLVADSYVNKINVEPYFKVIEFKTYEETEQYLFRFYINKQYTSKICATYEEEIPSLY